MSRTTSYMRPLGLVMLAALAAVALAAASPPATAAEGNCQPSGNEVVCTFDAPGTSTWTVPNGVTRATFDVFGAQGGKGGFDGELTSGYGGRGGLGGEAKATFSDLQPASQLQVTVGGAGQAGSYDFGDGGQGGMNGGANGGFGYSYGGGGGGASDIRFDKDGSGDFALDERIIVVAGGGGGGGGGGALYCYVEEPASGSYILLQAPGYPGGSGGGATGNPGEGGPNSRPEGGGGGTESAGGARGSYRYAGYDGDFGIGGAGGANGSCSYGGGAGGGGGGGYYGGGGSSLAHEYVDTQYGGAGGGGGSGFVSPEGANALLQPEARSGDGKVTITYTAPDTDPPTVKDATPQAGATRVSRTAATVKANFSEEVQAATLTSDTVQLFSGNSTKQIKATLSKTSTSVTLSPSQRLDAKTTYTAKIKGGSSGVKDLVGNPLASDFSWSFTTGSQ